MSKLKVYTKQQRTRFFKISLTVLALAYAFVLVLGSTYAWKTSEDERINRFKTTRLEMKFTGFLGLQTSWSPKSTMKRDVAVVNQADSPGIVRVSLEELLLTFEIDDQDITGNGNLKEYATAGTPIKLADKATWQVGNSLEITRSSFYKGAKREEAAIDFATLASRTGSLKAINLEFNDARVLQALPTATAPITDNYWLYEDGYFYYSEIILPSETTEVLLASTTLSAEAANDMKFGLYNITGELTSYTQSKAALTQEWGLTPASLAYQMLQAKVY